MTAKLDVLVTISDTTPREYVDQCLQSVEQAVSACPYPVNVIETPGVPGHVGEAMRIGFEKTTAQYVTWVDDDDFVLPPAFSCLEQALDKGVQAIYTRELHMLEWKITPYRERHHMAAFRRDVITNDWFAKPVGIRRGVFLGKELEAIDVLSWVYVYRIRNSAARQLRVQEMMRGRSNR